MLRFRQVESLEKSGGAHSNLGLVDRQTDNTRRSVALTGWQKLVAGTTAGDGRTRQNEPQFARGRKLPVKPAERTD